MYQDQKLLTVSRINRERDRDRKRETEKERRGVEGGKGKEILKGTLNSPMNPSKGKKR